MQNYHTPVLKNEVIDSLNINPNGTYLDGTAGGGGHSYCVASKLDNGLLLALDQDPDAIKHSTKRLQGLPVEIVKENFVNMDKVINQFNISCLDGILLDIGVSSHQLDDGSRGFSYHEDANLDMRMSQSGKTAGDIISSYSQKQLTDIFFQYGQERYARSIATGIVKQREESPINTTLQLVEIISENVPSAYRRKGHPARKTFQALRIAVNDELNVLSNSLDTALQCLCVGGRLTVITFHSLEDRIVKHKFIDFCTGCTCPPEFPICVCDNKPKAKHIHRRPVVPCEKEVQENPRSRSAKLRCIEKI